MARLEYKFKDQKTRNTFFDYRQNRKSGKSSENEERWENPKEE